MSEKPNLQQQEIDLGTLFSQIGQMFKNFFNSIGDLFKKAFHYGILLILFIRKNYIVVGITTLLGIAYGVYNDYNSDPYYESELIIETNYGSGNQLYKQVDFINELIATGDYNQAAKLLKVSPKDVEQLIRINIEPDELEKQTLLAYDAYMQETDTIFTRKFEVEDYSQRRKDTDLRFHKLTVLGKNKIDFSIYSNGIAQLAENPFYTDLKNKHLADLLFEKKELVDDLNALDSIRKRYDRVALLQATTPKLRTDLSFSTSKSAERNFDIDLISWSERLLKPLRIVEKKILRNDAVSRVVTDFGIGVQKEIKTWPKMGVFGFLFALFVLAAIEFNKYLNSYQKKNS